MRKIILIIFLLSSNAHQLMGQADTLVEKNQKGFLFLTDFNFQYDAEGEEVRSLGFHDFYFPLEGNNMPSLLDSNIHLIFKNGIRVDLIENRRPLKENAMVFQCVDTSDCYRFNQFYVIPVTIDYKMFKDYFPLVCDKPSFELQVTRGSHLRFEYRDKAMLPVKITVMDRRSP